MRVLLVVILAVVALALAWQLRALILLVLLAILVAAALSVPVDALARRGVPRVIATLVAYVALLAALAAVAALLVPPLEEQVGRLADRAPQLIEEARAQIDGVLNTLLPGSPTLQGLVSRIEQELATATPAFEALLRVPIALVEGIVNVVVVLFLSALLVVEAPKAEPMIRRLAGPARAGPALELLNVMREQLSRFVGAQLLVMAVVGLGVAAGMSILGVPYVVPMAILAFVTEAIPLIGPYIGGVPIIALAFLQSPVTGVLMAVWILIVQQLEGYVILPFIEGRRLRLPPVVVLVAVLAGASLSGILGALLAVPLMALAQVVGQSVILPVLDRRHEASGANR